MKVTNKVEMYRMLAAGKFGNTVPMWFNLKGWGEDVMLQEPYRSIDYWGIRTLTPGGPCYLNVFVYDVYKIARDVIRRGYDINISPMIDRLVTVTMWANICRDVNGLYVEHIENPPKSSNWREMMPTSHLTSVRTAAKLVLEKHLNPDTLADLEILLDRYPDAVVELSATEKNFGTVPGRNAIIWEVRNY